MSTSASRRPAVARGVITAGVLAVLLAGVLGPACLLALLAPRDGHRGRCAAGGGTGSGGGSIPVTGPGGGLRVGATEFGGPGDPATGSTGASGVDLDSHPDSYAELGGPTFATATAMGGLAFETPLRITWGGHSAIALKRDIGLGGGPVDGLPRVIDLWWQFARALGIPYEGGRWSGPVRVGRPPATGAGEVLGEASSVLAPLPATGPPPGCGPTSPTGPPTTVDGSRARLVGDLAAAPASAPAAVKGMIAAGNAIVGKPYQYGGGHGLPLNEIASTYDCSSSVEHLLWGGGLLGADAGGDSTTLESFGAPGPGRWVTIYASSDHVFMYVAGLRWDTHDAAGAGDGTTGIGWHPLVREDDGFTVRHPVGL